MENNEGIIRISELTTIVEVSRSTIWRLEKSGDFPKRRKLGSNSVGWLKSEVYEWLQKRPRTS